MKLRPLLIGAAVSTACLFGFWELAEEFAFAPDVRAFDVAVSSAIVSLRTPWLTALMRGVTATGGFLFVTTVTVGLVAWQLAHNHRAAAIFSAVVVAGGGLTLTVAKDEFARPRPPVADALVAMPASYSFPSGHTMGSLCLAAALTLAVMDSDARGPGKAAVLAACAVYPLAVGFSRVYLGVHYPSDVVASWLLGGALIALAWGGVRGLGEAGASTSAPD